MKAENTLQILADFHSNLFPTRKHAILYLFCVSGNGYRWHNGQLVNTDKDSPEYRYKLLRDVKKAVFPAEDIWWSQYNIWMHLKEECANADPEGYELNVPFSYQFDIFQPSKETSHFYNYPKGIQLDWMILRNECKQILKEFGIPFEE